MPLEPVDRRSFLKTMGSASLTTALPASAFAASNFTGSVVHEIAQPAQTAAVLPANSVRFAVVGMSHDHIYGMIGAIQRGGGEMVLAWAGEEDKLATFKKRFPDVKIAKSQEEIIGDSSIQLVLSSQIASERAPLGVKVMRHGKDFLADKPGLTTLEQLAEVRKTIAETLAMLQRQPADAVI